MCKCVEILKELESTKQDHLVEKDRLLKETAAASGRIRILEDEVIAIDGAMRAIVMLKKREAEDASNG